MIEAKLIINLLLILLVAWMLGTLFSRFGLPVMLGELLAGLVLGPPLLGIVTSSPSIHLIADWGIFFVMFYTGMEIDPRELLEHFWPSLAVAVGGFVLPFALGYTVCRLFGGSPMQSLFIGLGISVTAIAVQSVILSSLRVNKTELGHIVIGAAVATDIMALVVLSFLLGYAREGQVGLAALSWTLGKIVAFFGATIVLGHFVAPRFTRKLHDREGKAFTFAMACALLMAYLAELAGLHIIIGAFLAGQFVRKDIMDEEIYMAINDRFFGLSYGFLVPIFFATLSFNIDFTWSASFVSFILALTAAALLGKLVGGGLGVMPFRKSAWESAIVGFGMNGRGSMELVIAVVVTNLSNDLLAKGAIAEPLLTKQQFSALVLLAFITTFISPIAMKWTAERTCLPDEKTAFCTVWDEQRGRGGG